MPRFTYDNGKFQSIEIPGEYDKTKLYLSAEVVPDKDIIKIAGHSIIDWKKIEIEEVIFSDHPLTQSANLYGQQLEVEVNASKIKTEESDENGSKVPVSCKLTIEAGDDLLEEFELSDKKNPSGNAIFIFKIKFKKENNGEQ